MLNILNLYQYVITKIDFKTSLLIRQMHIYEICIYIYAFFIVRLNNVQFNLKVHVGTNFMNVQGDVYDVAGVTSHKGFNSFQYVNDVALVHLNTPIRYSTLVQPIHLTASDKEFEGKPCTLSGWGTTWVILNYNILIS